MSSFRVLRALIGVVLVGACLLPEIAVSSASATVVPTCNAQNFVATSTITSRPGGATVRLVLTSGYFPNCRWSNATAYQFASSSGASIGAKVSLASTKGLAVPQQPWIIGDTFQLIQNLVTEEGVQCTQSQASYVRISSPGSGRLLAKLPSSLGVCVNGTTKWTSISSISFPEPSACASSALRMSVGQSNGTAGTIFYPLIVTNVSKHACVVSGTPSVQPTTGSLAGLAHILVGPAATIRDTGSTGYGDSIRLAPGQKASAAYGVVETGNFSPSQCVAKSFQSLSVGIASASGGANYFLALASTACTKLASTNISGFVPGITGIAP
ncbi:MAG: DUF4232 domain-containing protein [Acidimicrobiales bacterium]